MPSFIPWPGCLASPPDIYGLVGWIPCLTVAATFFLLTIVKFTSSVKKNEDGIWQLFRLHEVRSYSPLVVAFVRDGTVFFFLIFSALVFCTVTTLVIKTPLAGVGFPWLITVYSFSASRLVLGLREASKQKHLDLSLSTISHSQGGQEMTLTPLAFHYAEQSGSAF
ncbi:hypothetical protein Hypma_006442 [Hypsizygus marmoreus]|uniref:Uncharacterized protein n=1 Tax=Hypsizygus marmoreus TaxID=39966 RepID=A0A369JVB2_HYPMA|nr:hypothetical protein Hypma_006442 [Hypsizygus marmoreus]